VALRISAISESIEPKLRHCNCLSTNHSFLCPCAFPRHRHSQNRHNGTSALPLLRPRYVSPTPVYCAAVLCPPLALCLLRLIARSIACAAEQSLIVEDADFQHILRILNTNVDGRHKVTTTQHHHACARAVRLRTGPRASTR
jgi:hypothetical protein